jgi:hypothetical protein
MVDTKLDTSRLRQELEISRATNVANTVTFNHTQVLEQPNQVCNLNSAFNLEYLIPTLTWSQTLLTLIGTELSREANPDPS